MTALNVAANYDRFTTSAFRLETLQQYRVPSERTQFQAFLDGAPHPSTSVRTSPWMARMAATTAAGKVWSRVHVVDFPLTDYLRYELQGYLANQVVGEQIRLVNRAEHPEFAGLAEDFWLFDDDTDRPFAHRQLYDPDGTYRGSEAVTDAVTIARYRHLKRATWTAGRPLDAFLAGLRQG